MGRDVMQRNSVSVGGSVSAPVLSIAAEATITTKFDSDADRESECHRQLLALSALPLATTVRSIQLHPAAAMLHYAGLILGATCRGPYRNPSDQEVGGESR